MTNKKNNIQVRGHKGDETSQDVYVPTEAENTLRSKSRAFLLDVLGEGEISGPAVDDSWYKSTYLNETPVVSTGGDTNFEGVTITGRNGSSTQEYIPGFDQIEAETSMNLIDITYDSGPVAQSITNSDLDDLRVTLQWNAIVQQTDKGDLTNSSVEYKITVTPDGGTGIEQTALQTTVVGKCTSPYRRSHVISDVSQYGAQPWVIKVYRLTADSTSSKITNTIKWYSYTEIVNVKMRHPDTALTGVTFDSELFGDTLPSRAYRVKGRLIQYPSNYDPDTRTYTGIWDGTFSTGYCNNPAWVVYDMIVNDRFGVGLDVSYIDKWSLYTIGEYCDETITYTSRYRNADGTYTSDSTDAPRFTFNGIIQTRQQALKVIANICSVFIGFPVWSTGDFMLSFVQDSPKEVTKVANPSNVIDGLFEYGPATEKGARTTAVNVAYNDMDNFGRTTIPVPVRDDESIQKYGYNSEDITAFGCTSVNEAAYKGKSQLYTNNKLTEPVSFIGGMEWADLSIGEIIGVQDPNYANITLSGRILSSTSTSVTVDREIELEIGVTYTITFPEAEGMGAVERTLTNSPATTDTFTWSSAVSPLPGKALPWILSSSSVAIRKFMAMGKTERENTQYEVSGILYDENKWDYLEDGIIVDTPEGSTVPTGIMADPSDITIQPYTYTEGDQDIRKYGMLISWTQSTDPRAVTNRMIASYNDGGWYDLDTTPTTSYDYRDIFSGSYDIGIQAQGAASKSNWVYYNDFPMGVGVDYPAPPTDLQCVDDPLNNYFNGTDCAIEWTASTGSDYTYDVYLLDDTGDNLLDDSGDTVTGSNVPFDGTNEIGVSNIKGYQIEVYDGTTLLRTVFTEGRSIVTWIYTLAMNTEDNTTPIRNINFRVYTVDVSDQLSLTYASLSASNPAPDLSAITPSISAGGGFIDIGWTNATDTDMNYYSVLIDSSEVERVVYPNNYYRYIDVEVGTTYTVQIVPYDEFGIGTGSQTNTGSPAKIPAVNVDVELSGSIVMSDSDSNTQATLDALYDGVKTSGGVSYTLSGTDKYIQYEYGVVDYIDRFGLWTADANAKVYFALSEDGSSWTYYKADADHTVDSGALTEATNQTDAQTNYLQMVAGLNVALLPNNVVAKYVKVFMTGTYSTTIYEYVPSRILISELAAIDSLSTTSANLGVITAGLAQSTDGNLIVDFDNVKIKIFSDTLTITPGVNDQLDWVENSTTYNATLTEDFTALSQGTLNWTGTTTLDDDVYACVSSGDIYKQEGGTGSFTALSQTSRDYRGMTTYDGDVYVCVYGGDIYKQTGGTGTFTGLSETSRNWIGMTTLGNDIYASVYGGDIYKQTNGTGSFTALSQTTRNWGYMTVLGKNVYISVYGDDIYKQTNGTGDFETLDQSTLNWNGMTTFDNNVYATVYGGDIYKQTNGFGDFVALDQGTVNWNDMTVLEDTVYVNAYGVDIYTGGPYTPTELAAHVQALMIAAGDADTEVTYNSANKKITIENDTLTTLSLLWDSGTNADESCGGLLGFDTSFDDINALIYSSDNEVALRVLIGEI